MRRTGSTRLVYRIDTLPGSSLSTKALIDQVSGPTVCTVSVPCADGGTLRSLCPTFGAAVINSSLPAAQFDFPPYVDVNGVLFAEVHSSDFVSINVPIEPQGGNLISFNSSRNELLFHEFCQFFKWNWQMKDEPVDMGRSSNLL